MTDSLASTTGATEREEKIPMVSVHCITFNHGAFIAQALDSFLKQQTKFEVEIVVGEDCSTDDTRDVVERYLRLFRGRIRLITSESNVGPAANFERTLQACHGKYVAICEGDDYWQDTSKLQQQVDFLEKQTDFVLCFHDAIAFDQSGFESHPQLPAHLQKDATAHELIQARPISTLTVCFRNVIRELPAEVRNSPILDLCLWSLLGHHGRGKYLPNIRPAAYRKHAGGLMSLQPDDHRLRNTAQAFLCLARYYERQNLTQHVTHFTQAAAIACGNALDRKHRLLTLAALADSLLRSSVCKLRAFLWKP